MGGMLSFELRGGTGAAERFTKSLTIRLSRRVSAAWRR